MPSRDSRSEGTPGERRRDAIDLDQETLHSASRRLLQRSRVFLDAEHPILVRDGEGRVIDLDNEAIRSLGWSREEFLGRPFEEAFAPEWREALRALLDRCRAGEEIHEEAGMLWSRQEERIPVLLSLSRLSGESHDSHTIAATAQEIGERAVEEEGSRWAVASGDEPKQDEQRSLGSALHDSIGQLLPLARMKLAALREELPDPLRGRVEEVDRLLSDAEMRTRTLMFQLSPAVLHDLGIAAAAAEVADEMHEHYGLRLSIVDDGERKPLTDAQRTALFRGLRELLINVARHAETDAASVHIDRDEAWVWVRVEDQGRGFEPSVRGFGLRSVAERLARIGGRLEVDSAPGEGARLRMAVPIREREPAGGSVR